MPFYKTPDNAVHFIDSVTYVGLLPAGAVPITDAEADALRQEPSVLPPAVVTRAQFKLALLDIGLLDDVDALVAASTDRALQINWAERLEFERNHPLVIATAAALGKTDAEIDALFVLAASK